MRRRTILMLVLIPLLSLPMLPVALARGGDRYVHVRILDRDAADEEVRLDVPVGLLRAFLAHADVEVWDRDLSLRYAGGSEVDLREVLAALREAPEGEFLRIRERDESVRVAKEGGFFLVRVDERDGDRLRVRFPLAVLDTLIDSGTERLDFAAALEALSDYDGDDLLTVESDDEQIRIWIDGKPSGD